MDPEISAVFSCPNQRWVPVHIVVSNTNTTWPNSITLLFQISVQIQIKKYKYIIIFYSNTCFIYFVAFPYMIKNRPNIKCNVF